jgi:hypothetical protein
MILVAYRPVPDRWRDSPPDHSNRELRALRLHERARFTIHDGQPPLLGRLPFPDFSPLAALDAIWARFQILFDSPSHQHRVFAVVRAIEGR